MFVLNRFIGLIVLAFPGSNIQDSKMIKNCRNSFSTFGNNRILFVLDKSNVSITSTRFNAKLSNVKTSWRKYKTIFWLYNNGITFILDKSKVLITLTRSDCNSVNELPNLCLVFRIVTFLPLPELDPISRDSSGLLNLES